MRYRLPRDVVIMFAAQNAVDQWLKAIRRQPFAKAVESEEERLWNGLEGYENERITFRALSDSIRRGQGHARSNPGPLLKQARQIRDRLFS